MKTSCEWPLTLTATDTLNKNDSYIAPVKIIIYLQCLGGMCVHGVVKCFGLNFPQSRTIKRSPALDLLGTNSWPTGKMRSMSCQSGISGPVSCASTTLTWTGHTVNNMKRGWFVDPVLSHGYSVCDRVYSCYSSPAGVPDHRWKWRFGCFFIWKV